MRVKESSGARFHFRYVVTFTVTDLTTNETYKTDLRCFDEFSDACVWIRDYGSAYARGKSGGKGTDRYFRIEKRYYLI